MAKVAVINRDLKRRETVKKYAARRAELMAIINDANLGDEDRHSARIKLQMLPRNSSPVRLRNRCCIDGQTPRCLQQIWARPWQTSRYRHERRNSGHDQGELVNATSCFHRAFELARTNDAQCYLREQVQYD